MTLLQKIQNGQETINLELVRDNSVQQTLAVRTIEEAREVLARNMANRFAWVVDFWYPDHNAEAIYPDHELRALARELGVHEAAVDYAETF